MKILYHHRTLGDGAEGIHVREMIRAFRAEGHEVLVTGPVGEPGGGEASRGSSRLSRFKALMPAVCFESLELAYGFAALFATMWQVIRFRPDFIYDRYMTFNFGVVLAARLCRVPVLLEVNAPLALERREQQDERLILAGLATWIESRTYRLASRVIVVSSPLRDHLLAEGLPEGRCVVMPNGANPEHFSVLSRDALLAARLKVPDEAFIIGFTGVLRGWHYLDLLVEALDILCQQGRKAALVIVGDGPYRQKLWESVCERGLDHSVWITGRVPHADVPGHISLFDAAVCPGATFYASPMKLLEYMAAGKAVVVPDTENFLDMVNPGVDGMVFHQGDGADLARQLAALQDSPALREAMGLAARRKVETRLNWRWNARACCDIVRELRGVHAHR